MKLYHGTAERHLPAILRDGLKPRGKRRGNWSHTIESNPDAVYLTAAYAIYFAMTATDAADKSDRSVVLEIDTSKLDPFYLVPDEDWLEQVSRKQNSPSTAPINKPMKYRTKWYRRRLLNYNDYWQDSLDGLGNCAYLDTIPAAAITRIAFIDRQTNADLMLMAGLDPTISLMNYRFVGQRYRNAMKKLFGEPVEEEDPFDAIRPPEQIAARDAALAEVWGRVEVRNLQ